MSLHIIVENITSLEQKYIIIILSILLLYINFYTSNTFIFTNIIITTLALAIFDVFIKNYFLLNANEYYAFVINNVITIVMINILVLLLKNNFKKITVEYIAYIAFSCLFYELVVFKLYNYNNLCNSRLRNSTKTIMRLATIHILSNFMSNLPFDKEWFDNSFAQLFNFSMFNIVFDN
jgi:hypothetical protein